MVCATPPAIQRSERTPEKFPVTVRLAPRAANIPPTSATPDGPAPRRPRGGAGCRSAGAGCPRATPSRGRRHPSTCWRCGGAGPLGAAEAREEALRLVRASAVVRERGGVVDAAGVEPGVQRVPARRFVGIHGRSRRHPLADGGHRLVLGAEHEGQRPAAAFAPHDDDPALARLVFGPAAVLCPDRAAEVGAVHLDVPGQHGLPSICSCTWPGCGGKVIGWPGRSDLASSCSPAGRSPSPAAGFSCRASPAMESSPRAARHVPRLAVVRFRHLRHAGAEQPDAAGVRGELRAAADGAAPAGRRPGLRGDGGARRAGARAGAGGLAAGLHGDEGGGRGLPALARLEAGRRRRGAAGGGRRRRAACGR